VTCFQLEGKSSYVRFNGPEPERFGCPDCPPANGISTRSPVYYRWFGSALGEGDQRDARGRQGNQRLYPNLDTLVNQDLVEKGQIDRRTNYYEETEKGLTALEAHQKWSTEQIG